MKNIRITKVQSCQQMVNVCLPVIVTPAPEMPQTPAKTAAPAT